MLRHAFSLCSLTVPAHRILTPMVALPTPTAWVPGDPCRGVPWDFRAGKEAALISLEQGGEGTRVASPKPGDRGTSWSAKET